MEDLKTLEKITLLISTCIVCVVNFFVLLERIKKSEKRNSRHTSQKLMALKNTFFVFCLITILGSCSGNKFLNRKYTSGKFTEHKKSLKHNTFYADTTANYSSLNNKIELKRNSILIESISEEKVSYTKTESIVKKDSIFIKLKKGRNEIITIKNNLPNVTIVINGDKKTVKPTRSIDFKKVKINQEGKIKQFSVLACCFALIPFLGFSFSITAKRIIRKYNKDFPLENKEKYKTISNFALVLSVLPSLFGILIFLVLLFALSMLLFGGGTLVVIM